MGRLIIFVGVIVLLSVLAMRGKQQERTLAPVQQSVPVQNQQKEKPVQPLLVVPVKVVKVPPPSKPRTEPLPEKIIQKPEPLSSPPQPAQHPDTPGDNTTQGTEGDQDPAVLASYGMPVTEYLQYMVRQGARIGLYNTRTAGFVCSLKSNGSFGGPLRQSGMSPRARRITIDFPGGREVLQLARQKFGQAHYEILLLLPRSMDDRFYRNINRVIREAGRSSEDVSMVRVTYSGSAGSIKVAVDKLEGKAGPVQLNRTFFM